MVTMRTKERALFEDIYWVDSESSRYSTRRSRFLWSMAMVVLPMAGKYIDARVLTSGLKFFSLEKLTHTAPGLIHSVSTL